MKMNNRGYITEGLLVLLAIFVLIYFVSVIVNIANQMENNLQIKIEKLYCEVYNG